MTLPPAAWVIAIIRPSTWSGTPEIMRVGGAPQARGPVAAHELVVGADAARGDDDGLRAQREVAWPPSRELAWPRRTPLGSRTRPAHAVDRAAADGAARRPGGGSAARPGPRRAASRTRRTNGSISPGPVPQVTWKRGTELPWPGRRVAAALGPADVGQQPHALGVQPRALLAGGEVDVGLGPAPRPRVLARGRSRRCPASPARPARASRWMPQPALLGAVDEEQPAEGPERLAAERRLGLLVDAGSPGVPASASSAVATSPASPPPTTMTSAAFRGVLTAKHHARARPTPGAPIRPGALTSCQAGTGPGAGLFPRKERTLCQLCARHKENVFACRKVWG